MPSSGTATVTGKTGAGLTMTAQTFTNITSFSVNIAKAMLQLVDGGGVVTDISIGAQTTFTITLSAAGGNYIITVS